MSKQPKKKLCWSCEGRVPKESENCPYCGVYLSPTTLENSPTWAPPYKMTTEEENSKPPAPPYAMALESETSVPEQETESSASDAKTITTSLILLLLGSAFLTFGLGLALFSTNGVLTLQWDATYWYFYVGLAVPMILFGLKSISNLK